MSFSDIYSYVQKRTYTQIFFVNKKYLQKRTYTRMSFSDILVSKKNILVSKKNILVRFSICIQIFLFISGCMT